MNRPEKTCANAGHVVVRWLLLLLLVVVAVTFWVRSGNRDVLPVDGEAPVGSPAVQGGGEDLSAGSSQYEKTLTGVSSVSVEQEEPPKSARPGGVLHEGEPAPIAPPEPLPSSQPLLQPDDITGMRFPVPDYRVVAGSLPKVHVQTWETFHAEFPGVDPSETYSLQGAITEKRAQFGYELNDRTRAAWHEWLMATEQMARAMVERRAAELGLAVAGVNEEGRGFWLEGFEGSEPRYVWTMNVEAAITTGANFIRLNPSFDPVVEDGVSGEGLYVNVNDSGTIYEHPEFQLPDGAGSRIVYKAVNDQGGRAHMTHVAGTVSAWGYNPILKGMAPRVWIRSYIGQSQFDITRHGMAYPGHTFSGLNPVTGEQEMRSVMGTTSLGSVDNNSLKGLYTMGAQTFDQVLWDYPYYIHFYAAGNAGSGFSSISLNHPVSKNTLTIGAVNEITRDEEGHYVSGGTIAGFSSRGPTYDGRIKPDFTANGTSVTSPNSLTGHTSLQGTSMATPNASGSTVLLIDYYNRKFPGHFLRSSSLRALLMTSALDRGHPGPDYTYGWGVIDVHKASKMVKHYAENPASRVLVEDELANNQTWTLDYTCTGEGPIIVSLAWLDPAGQPQSTWSGPTRDPRLVNDLDVRVIGPDQTHLPWVLPFTTGDGATPAYDDSLRNTAAVKGDNFTDPAEQVHIANPVSGVYTVEVTHKGTLHQNYPQKFSLAIYGMEATDSLAPSITSTTPSLGAATLDAPIVVNGSGFVVGTDILLRRDGDPDVLAHGVLVQHNRLEGRLDTTNLTRGYWHVVVRTPDGTEAIAGNAYLLPYAGERVTLFADDFESGTGEWDLLSNFAMAEPGKGAFGGPEIAYEGSKALVAYPGTQYTNYQSTTAYFPLLNTTGYREIQVEFRRWVGFGQDGTSPSAYGTFLYSLDNSNWNILLRYNDMDDDAWQAVNVLLPAETENHPSLRLQFFMTTQNAPLSYGWNIDNLRVTGVNTPILYPPIFTSTPATLSGDESDAYTYTISTTDADTPAEELVLSASGLPSGLMFTDHGNGTATLSGTLTPVGTNTVQISVTDGTYTTHQVFELTVMPEGGNTPPEITTLSPLPEAFVGEAYSVVISATDAEGHAIHFSTENRPGWLGFTDNGNGTATLFGTPPVGSQGAYTMTVTASDGYDSTSRAFDLLVRPRAFVEMVVSSISVIESQGSVNIEVARTITDAGEIRVDYTTVAQTAEAGSDFEHTSGTLVWADGDMANKTITVTIIDDDVPEVDETFRVELSSVTGIANLGLSSTVVTIIDDDIPPASPIAFGDLYLIEHGSVTEVNGVYTLTRTGDPAHPFQGYVLNFDPTELVTIGDFIEVSFRIKSQTSNNSVRQVSWGFFDGTAVSGHGQTNLTAGWEGYIHQIGSRSSSGTSGAGLYRQGTGPTGLMDHVGGGSAVDGASVTPSLSTVHQNNDVPVTVRIARISDAQVRLTSTFETPHTGGSNSGTNQGISWDYSAENHVCVLHSRYGATDGPVSFTGFAVASRGNNWVLQDLAVQSNVANELGLRVYYHGNSHTGGTVPSDDTVYETGASVTVLGPGTLEKDLHTFGGWNTQINGEGISRSPGDTFSMGDANVWLYAQWEGLSGELAFAQASYSVGKADGTVWLTVRRTGGHSGAASVHFATVNGTAVAGTHFEATSGTLHWADGDDADKTIPVLLINNDQIGDDIAFSVVLSDATGASPGTTTSATVTIEISTSHLLVFDPFTDGGITQGADPYDVAWLTSDGMAQLSVLADEQLDPVAPHYVANFYIANTNATRKDDYFSFGLPEAVNLDVGQTLRVSHNIRFADGMPSPDADRTGISFAYRSTGNTPWGHSDNREYFFFTSFGEAGSLGSIRKSSGAQLLNVGTTLASERESVNIGTNTVGTVLFEVTRTATSTARIRYQLNDGTVQEAIDEAADWWTFNRVFWRYRRATTEPLESLRVDDVKVELLTVQGGQAATVTLNSLSQSYNATARSVTVTTDPGDLAVSVTYNGAEAAPVNAGSYAVIATVTEPNYSGSTTGTLTVAVAPLTVTADPKSKTEGESDPSLTWQITAGQLFSTDNLSGHLMRETGEGSGVYAIQQGTLSAGANYHLTVVPAEFRILTAEGLVDSSGSGADDEWELAVFGNLDNEPVEIDGHSYTRRQLFFWNLANPTHQVFRMDGFQYTTVTGRHYQVQYRSSDIAGDWENRGAAQIGNGGNVELIGTDPGLYRVRVLLPPP